MARLIRWSPKSLWQIHQIGQFIANDSRIQAKRIVKQIYNAPEKLINNPRIGQIVPELSDDQIREIRIFSYRIIYRFSGENIDVAAVLHGRQLIDSDSI